MFRNSHVVNELQTMATILDGIRATDSSDLNVPFSMQFSLGAVYSADEKHLSANTSAVAT